jgi:hypothetical protein
MRYKVGAEQLERVPSLAHRPDGVFRVARTAPVGPTHAVCAQTWATVCGIKPEALAVLEEDWKAAYFGREMPSLFRHPRRRKLTASASRGGQRTEVGVLACPQFDLEQEVAGGLMSLLPPATETATACSRPHFVGTGGRPPE